jgi:hypothetical protein
MNLNISFSIDDAWFNCESSGLAEIRIEEKLQDIGREIRNGKTYGLVIDGNGNKVGYWEFTEGY